MYTNTDHNESSDDSNSNYLAAALERAELREGTFFRGVSR